MAQLRVAGRGGMKLATGKEGGTGQDDRYAGTHKFLKNLTFEGSPASPHRPIRSHE